MPLSFRWIDQSAIYCKTLAHSLLTKFWASYGKKIDKTCLIFSTPNDMTIALNIASGKIFRRKIFTLKNSYSKRWNIFIKTRLQRNGILFKTAQPINIQVRVIMMKVSSQSLRQMILGIFFSWINVLPFIPSGEDAALSMIQLLALLPAASRRRGHLCKRYNKLQLSYPAAGTLPRAQDDKSRENCVGK